MIDKMVVFFYLVASFSQNHPPKILTIPDIT